MTAAQVTPSRETFDAYNVLVSCAQKRRKITYKELYLAMAKELGWPAWKAGHAWFQRLPLVQVGTMCGRNGEPCLSSLVRQKDGGIGKGYQTAHFNCHGIRITSHDYACECGNCHYLIRNAARDEARAVFEHWAP